MVEEMLLTNHPSADRPRAVCSSFQRSAATATTAGSGAAAATTAANAASTASPTTAASTSTAASRPTATSSTAAATAATSTATGIGASLDGDGNQHGLDGGPADVHGTGCDGGGRTGDNGSGGQWAITSAAAANGPEVQTQNLYKKINLLI